MHNTGQSAIEPRYRTDLRRTPSLVAATARRVRNTPQWLTAMVIAGIVIACGGPLVPAGDGPATETGPPGGGASGGDGSTSGGSADGPIVVTMEEGTYAYPSGRCEIIDDVVYVTAVAENMRGAFEARLPAWEREIAFAQRDGSVGASHFGSSGSDNFELVASRSAAGTTWDWTVSGSNVEVTARMGNSSTATREGGVREFTEYRDVTIAIRCSGGPFGPAVAMAPGLQDEFVPMQPSLTRAPGSVTVDLEGTTYEITYLSTCNFFQESVTAEGIANDASVYLYSEGRGVQLDLFVGDRRAEQEGVRWSLPADSSLQDDFLFEGSDASRSWSGQIVSAAGEEAQATITVECTEGDTFTPAGSASVVLDGVTHVLDQVTTCTIEGTTIDFFGRSSASDVAIVVTGGGSEILLGDEEGSQTRTPNVAFDVVGQQATWTGTLAGDRQAAIVIECN
jgi:hypothetical protein